MMRIGAFECDTRLCHNDGTLCGTYCVAHQMRLYLLSAHWKKQIVVSNNVGKNLSAKCHHHG